MPAHSTKQRGVVLVADDDPVMRLLMLEMLDGVGLEGIEAADGAQAVTLARAHAPDLILLDVEMPKMDGFAACRANLRDHGLRRTAASLGTPQVIDHDARALGGEGQGELPTNAAAGPGDDHDFVCNHVRHVAS